ncbi:MAG: tRNA pseudouridine(38-40) synthase TruA [Desulfonatronovibrionaceae bacterium]
MRIRLTIAYDGTRYHGWQVQPGKPTIQGYLEEAIEKICSLKTVVHGSGRTDAGVHATGQTAHFDAPDKTLGLPWQKALNSILPSSIRIVRAQSAPKDFHARFSALDKTYSYTLWTENNYVLPQRRNYVWKTGTLDMKAMKAALEYIPGRRDFACFMNTGTLVNSTVRNIMQAWFSQGLHPQETVIRITADGFLKQMVRNIVGTLVWAGRGRLAPEEVKHLILKKDRSLVPATAPALGLCLEQVNYPDD